MTIQQLLLGGGAGEQIKYVDDYYNFLSYSGDGQQNRVIETGIDLSSDGGMVMFYPERFDMDWLQWGSSGRSWSCADTVTGSTGAWRSWTNSEYSASSSNSGLVSNFGNGTITICDRTPAFNGSDNNNMVNACNFSEWCRNSNRKGGVFNSGYSKYNLYVFRQLEGYFKIVTWTGTGGSRAVAHGLGAEPGLIMIWGGTGFRVWSWGDTTGSSPSYDVAMDKDGFGHSSKPVYSYGDSTNIYVNSGWNYSGQTFVAYVWARATSNSKIHGDGENECFTFQCGARRSGWSSSMRPKADNIYGQPGGIASHVTCIKKRSSGSGNDVAKTYDYMIPGRPMGAGFNMQAYGYTGSGRFSYMAGSRPNNYVNGSYGTWFGIDLQIGGVSEAGSADWPDVGGHGCFYGHNNSDGASISDVYYTFRYPNMKPPKHGSDIFNASWYHHNKLRGINPIFQGNARGDFVITSSETSYQSSQQYTKSLSCRAFGWTQVGQYNYCTLTNTGYTHYAGYTGYNGSNDFTWNKGFGGSTKDGNNWNSSYARFAWAFRDRLKTCHHFFRTFKQVGTVNHSLQAVPSMIIAKQTQTDYQQTSTMNSHWCVYHKDMNEGSSPQNYGMYLNTNIGKQQSSGFWNNTAPTSTTFGVGNKVVDATRNDPVNRVITLMFADTPGILKTGKYTGNGSFVNVNCGFSDGVRFVLVKREDWSGHWYVFDHAHGLGGGQYIDEAVFNTTGSHNWTCPSGVTSVSAVCVGGGGGGGKGWQDGHNEKRCGGGGGGLGWKNNISVTPGQTYAIYVGKHGVTNGADGEDSYFINTSTVKGGGGESGSGTSSPGAGGTYTGDGGGNGGAGAAATSGAQGGGYLYTSSGGGGGAGGYSGNGGAGNSKFTTGWPDYTAQNGSGGGGGGSSCGPSGNSTEVAGGVGLYGEGESGTIEYTNGKGDISNLTSTSNSDAYVIGNPNGGSLPPGFSTNGDGYGSEITANLYSFGAGLQTAGSTAGAKTNGANGGVRLVWSTNASETVAFPSTNVGCARPPYQIMNDAHCAPIYNQRWLCSLPTGFGVHDNSNLNTNGGKYIYLAISGADNAWKKR